MADNVIDRQIGMVTAYAYAVSKGYTGTEEEFAEALANVGINIEEIQEAIDTFNDTTVPQAINAIVAKGNEEVGIVNTAGAGQVQAVNNAGTDKITQIQTLAANTIQTIESKGAEQVSAITTEGTAQVSAVTAEGTAQVSAVTAEGTAQVAAVNGAGETQISAVNTAGTTQVGNVNTAGSTQVSAIQTKGEEVLESIPDDYTALSEDVEALINDHPVSTVTGNPAVAEKALGVNAKSLVADFEPIQDLHGYDHPWPAGGGKNLFNPDSILVGTYDSSKNEWYCENPAYNSKAIEMDFDENTQYSFSGIATQGVANKNLRLIIKYSDNTSVDLWGSNITDPLTFNVTSAAGKTISSVVFNYGTNGGNVTVRNFQIEKGSTATEYEPYSNICPISGRDSVSVNRTGKNLANIDSQDVGADGSYFDIPAKGGRNVSLSLKVERIPNATITNNQLYAFSVKEYNAYGVEISGTTRRKLVNLPSGASPITVTDSFVLNNSTTAIRLFLENNNSDNNVNTRKYDIQLEYSNTPTSYEPYTGESITINLGNTVYGGTLDVKTGVLTVTHGTHVCDGTEGIFSNADGNYQIRADDGNGFMNDFKKASSSDYLPTCTHYKGTEYQVASLRKNGECAMFNGAGATSIYFLDNRFSSANEFSAFLTEQYTAGTPVTFAAELATPTEITLTPAQVKLLQGLNNIWADSGTLTVEYFQSVSAILAEMESEVPANIAPVEGNTASANYAVGSYLMHNDTLYKVIAAITTGETLAAGTNIQATTIMAELLAKTS